MKRRGYPDRRGMSAQSDFVTERFVPSQQYKAQQQAIIRNLMAAGVDPQVFAGMVLLATAQMPEEVPSDI
jgi:hypothetical protein